MKKARLRKKAKGLLYASNIWCVSEGMIGPLFALFGERIGGSILDVSIAWALYLTMSGILIMVTGKISDKLVKKEVLLIAGYLILTLFTFGYIFVNSREALFLVQIGLGIGTSLATPTWDALYAKHTRKSKDGYAWGMANGQADLITGLATVVGGLVVNFISFNFLFLLMGIIEFIATTVLIKTFGKDILTKPTEEKTLEIIPVLKAQKQAS
jgi:predicted MFS family arabinose efflux permease